MTILHLFPNLMNLYGDGANRRVLVRFLRESGMEVQEILDDGAEADFANAHCILMGPGTERAQRRALDLLRPRAGDLSAAVAGGTPVLLTGNAAELPGQTILAGDEAMPGLGLYPFTVTRAAERVVGDVVARAACFDLPLVGFYNHMGIVSNLPQPLFQNTLGPLPVEGYADRNLLATYLIGPLLVRNPHVLLHFARRVAEYARPGAENGDFCPGAIHPAAQAAYQNALRGLSSR